MKKVVIYAILLMMFVNMIPVNLFADSKVVNVKVLTDDEMKNIIGAGSNNGGGNSGSDSTRKEIEGIWIKRIYYDIYSYNKIIKISKEGWMDTGPLPGNYSISDTSEWNASGSINISIPKLKDIVSVNVGASYSESKTYTLNFTFPAYHKGIVCSIEEGKVEKGTISIKKRVSVYDGLTLIRQYNIYENKNYIAIGPESLVWRPLFKEGETINKPGGEIYNYNLYVSRTDLGFPSTSKVYANKILAGGKDENYK
ncbi:hypothetical protein X275_09635 [Marinitoga sp. 1197]|uniref:hypothetical protein n=1 Tax=Marinitoga sp. 1197 TaxID=1428449 RepID=UPI000640D809|nr:hypothetical protein [Marinitoga sp. 1197]KLO21297.1 hypothetical protein X275_09635 [Marinitoga sp. 1197]